MCAKLEKKSKTSSVMAGATVFEINQICFYLCMRLLLLCFIISVAPFFVLIVCVFPSGFVCYPDLKDLYEHQDCFSMNYRSCF